MENTATTSNTTPTEKNKESGSSDDFDPSLSEEERRFYLKAYPTVDIVRERKVHCTVCKTHIGTAPCQEAVIKMHPVLRVTHCTKCHDFYNSGEFSKGEDGSELYCRWCGQGGEVYCCSNCPYVFCKTCIVKNLSRGVVADIEQNENWSCFNCAPKILWPLRAQHWALMKYIDEQKKEFEDQHISESEKKQRLSVDRSTCCRLAKAKGNNMSDSMESIDSSASRRSQGSGNNSAKRPSKPLPPTAVPLPKRSKNANDEVVCTPDLITMLEPDCQITMPSKSTSILSSPSPASTSTPSTSVKNTTPKVMYIPKNYPPPLSAPQSLVPPPLVLRNTSVQMRPVNASSLVRRTVIGPQPPSPTSTAKPVYHTINGFRIDLNTAAQQETFRLPNGKLIQVKRQGFKPQNTNTPPNWQSHTGSSNSNNNANSMQAPAYHHQQQPTARAMQAMPTKPHSGGFQPLHLLSKSTSTAAGSNHPPQSQTQPLRYHTILGNTTVTPIGSSSGNSAPVQMINGSLAAPIQTVNSIPTNANNNINPNSRPQMVRHVFPDTGIGRARTQLQNQIFNTNDICQHLINKLHTLTNSNAYKQAKSYVEMKELYIHLSYLLSYAIGRFKTLQDNSLDDMRQLGFVSDADSLENGQLAAGSDYVRYAQIEDVELFNTGSNSFHNQVYEYRKSLHANLKDETKPTGGESPSNPNNMNDFEEEPPNAKLDIWAEDDDDEGEEEDWKYAERMQADFGENVQEEEEEECDEQQNLDASNDMHAFDRKLTQLVQKYPSIWCTRHADYGNFDVTRKQWRAIAAQFDKDDNIKQRWKNIRKRFVRIERRAQEGKRFGGYIDKAANFLTNRDLPMEDWMPVDCGNETAGEVEDYNNGNEIDDENSNMIGDDRDNASDADENSGDCSYEANNKIDISPMDLKIIHFVKRHTILWRKTTDPENIKSDDQVRKSLWVHFLKHTPNITYKDITERWQYLYDMYKTFRLKRIKDTNVCASLEIKYSKYLAILSFLYSIDENVLRNETDKCDLFFNEEQLSDERNDNVKLKDMPDDKEFLVQLVRAIHERQMLWDSNHMDYFNDEAKDLAWNEIHMKLKHFKRDLPTLKRRWQLAKFAYELLQRETSKGERKARLQEYYDNLPINEMDKHASDDEIEIVEPKTDTITLDSDNESEEQNSVKCTERSIEPASTTCTTVTSTTVSQCQSTMKEPPAIVDSAAVNNEKDNYFSAVQPFLASMLEVEISEPGAKTPKKSATTTDGVVKKQPRKKTTIKPNPLLLKQKAQLEQERLEELKRSDSKLKMKCAIPLKKAEVEYPFARAMIDEKIAEKSFNADDTEMQEQNDTENKEEKSETMNVSDNSTNNENAEGSDLNENEKISDNAENKTDIELKKNNDKKIVDDNESSVEGVVKSTEARENHVMVTDEHAEVVDVVDNEKSIDNINDEANEETSKMECKTLVTKETDEEIRDDTLENCRDDDKEEEGTDMPVDNTEISEITADVISNVEKELAKNTSDVDSDSPDVDKDKNKENRTHEEVNKDDDNDKTSTKCDEQKDNAESNRQKIVSLDAAIVEVHKTESNNAEISTTTSADVSKEEASTDLTEEEIVEATDLHSKGSKDVEPNEIKSIVDMDIADNVAKSSNNTSTMQRKSTELTNTIRVGTSVEVIET